MAPEHQQAVSQAQWDEAPVTKIKSAVDEKFHVWFDGLDAVTTEAADHRIFRKKWLKSHFGQIAKDIVCVPQLKTGVSSDTVSDVSSTCS